MPPQRPRAPRRAVHGVLLLDKPAGLSSNAALQVAKRLYRAEKAGHTGTLDPLASGLLPLCFGAATKFAQVSLDADKRYLATLHLGVTTTTGDAEGEVVAARPVTATPELVRAACARFTGAIDQVPPMHSALKRDGRPLYAYARAGIEIERAARAVTVHSIDIVDGRDAVWTLDVRCSKGTYIRTLAVDVGEALGCGAHLGALRRTGCGALDVAAAVSLERLEALSESDRDAALLPTDALLADWPKVELGTEDAGRFLSGLRRRLPLADAPAVRVYGPAPEDRKGAGATPSFLGSAHIRAGELISTRLLSPVEVEGLQTDRRLNSESIA
jgi:tRNA pseudouridine55 synthase